MKKNGFTLIELLAVVVILAIVSTITYITISKNIETAKRKTYETSVQNVLEASKQYVITNELENDFPEGGIDISNGELNLKNDKFISGVIYRNSDGIIYVENVTDGDYCASGSKNDLTIVPGSCETSDETPPELELKVLSTNLTSSSLLVKMQDRQSGISSYSYCYSNCSNTSNWTIKEKSSTIRSLIKEIVEINNLDGNKTYTLKVKAINGNNMETSKEISITTLAVEKPQFKISSSTYTSAKIVTITYPKNSLDTADNYIYKYTYQIDNDEPVVINPKENIAKIDIQSNATIKAKIEYNGGFVEEELTVIGIDKDVPVVNIEIPNENEWTKSKVVKINAVDTGVGLAYKAYSYNNGILWQKEAEKIIEYSQTLRVKVRDRLGNISDKFSVNGIEYTEYPFNKIDNEGPGIKLEIVEGSKENSNNEWYTSNKVIVKAIVIDQVKIIDDSASEKIIEGGVGVDSTTVKLYLNNVLVASAPVEPNTYLLEITKAGTNTIKVEAADLLGNTKKDPASMTVKIDPTVPTITTKEGTNYITLDQNKVVTDYFNISSYGVSGGTTICYVGTDSIVNVNELTKAKNRFGINTITCKMSSVSGKVAEVSTVVRHQYNASVVACTSGRTLSGSNCTYYYPNNEAKCGCGEWNKTCSEYNQSCTSYNQVCSEYNQTCTSYNQVCTGFKVCQKPECGADYNRCSGYTGWSFAGTGGITNGGTCFPSSSTYVKYECARIMGSNPVSYVKEKYTRSCASYYYASCATAACGCASTVNGTCATYANTTCKKYVNGTCNNWVNTTCKTYKNTSCKTSNSCTLNENEYRVYSCLEVDSNNKIGTLSGTVCYF